MRHFYKIAQKVSKIVVNFCEKICGLDLSKIAQSGHSEYRCTYIGRKKLLFAFLFQNFLLSCYKTSILALHDQHNKGVGRGGGGVTKHLS